MGWQIEMTERRRWIKFIPLLIVAAGAAVYLNSFSGVFVFDDVVAIEENPKIRSFLPLRDLMAGQRPLVNLSLAVNYAIGGLDVRGYHAFNLAVHLLAALALYGIVRRTLSGKLLGERYGRAAPGMALAVALIWVVHPLQTQSVTYVIQRAESMMGLGYLLTLYCFIRGSDSPRRTVWYGAAVLACTMGMASKPIIVTAPLMILVYDRVFLAGSFRELLRRRWGLYGALMLTWGVLAAVGLIRGLFNLSEVTRAGVGFGYVGVTPLEYLLTQSEVILHYLKLSLWPRSLCLDYAWPIARSTEQIVFSGLAIFALLASVVVAFRHRPWLGFAGAWFFIILSPSSSFVPVPDLAFEHRMYLPLAAVVMVFVAAGYKIRLRLQNRFPAQEHVLRVVAVLFLAAIVLALGARTIRRNQDYRSDLVMWENVLAQRPDNSRAHASLGGALIDRGESEEAIAHYLVALEVNPRDPLAHSNLGLALYLKGEVEDAHRHYLLAVEIDPRFYRAHYGLGVLLASAGRTHEAIEHYEKAVQIRPGLAEGHNNLGSLLRKVGRDADAVASYRRALKVDPTDALAHFNLGLALADTGNLDEAIAEMHAALRLDPREHATKLAVGAHYSLARFYALKRRTDEAIAELEAVVAIDPDHPQAPQDLEVMRRLRDRAPSN